MSFSNIVLISATACTALVAGLLFSYSCSVNPAFKTLPDREYIMGMQAINKAIQNPVFFLVLFGALLLIPLSAGLNYSTPPSSRFWLLVIATILYAGGVLGVTAAGNIPLNNALEKFNLLAASKDAIAEQRVRFENPWNTFHTIRTLASILALVLLICACTLPGKK